MVFARSGMEPLDSQIGATHAEQEIVTYPVSYLFLVPLWVQLHQNHCSLEGLALILNFGFHSNRLGSVPKRCRICIVTRAYSVNNG